MKRYKLDIIFGAIILLHLVVICILLYAIHGCLHVSDPPDIHPVVLEFSVSDYQQTIQENPVGQNVGKVPDRETAIKTAKELWVEKYGIKNNDPTNGWEPIVCFDETSNCWLVTLSLPKTVKKASVPSALIEKDGTVLSVWLNA